MLFFFAASMYICAAAASVIQITGANTMRFCKPQGHTINHGAQILRIVFRSRSMLNHSMKIQLGLIQEPEQSNRYLLPWYQDLFWC